MGDRESDYGVVQEDGDVLETVSILSGQMLPHTVVTGRVPTVKTRKNGKGDVSGDARSESAQIERDTYKSALVISQYHETHAERRLREARNPFARIG